jgi:hypothetical protein
MIGLIARLAKILKHVFKYLPLYIILWGFLKNLGKKIMKPFADGRNDTKSVLQTQIEAADASKKQNETIREQFAFKVPQEIRGVSLKPEELALLETGIALFIANMNENNGEKFSSFVKVNKEQGKLEFYNENPDRTWQNINQTAAYNKPQTDTADQKRANSKKIKR